MCGAPIVLNMLVHAPADAKRPLPVRTKVATGGAAPPAIVIERMEAMGFEVLHLYGTTESYGPSTYCAPMPEWQALPAGERYALMARQGIPNPAHRAHDGRRPARRSQPVPQGRRHHRRDHAGRQYADEGLPQERGGDGGGLRRRLLPFGRPRRRGIGDGSIEVKDRSKDIIISGGENISSLEVEEVLYRHPQVMEAAVVARLGREMGRAPRAPSSR